MINLPNDKELQLLKATRTPNSISAYIAFSTASSDPTSSRIEYKNTLRDIETMLTNAKAAPQYISDTLQPLYDLLDTNEFWPPKHESLAIFANQKVCHIYHVPEGAIRSELTVTNGFSMQQLEELTRNNQPYFFLALSRKKTQLYTGDRYHLMPIDIKNLPADMETALQIDEYPHSQQFHGVRSETGSGGSSSVHDQSEVKNTDKAMALEFFRLVDKHLKPVLTKANRPLVIGGVENLLALYNKVNSYPGLVKQYIYGNLDHAKPDAIRAKVLPLLQ